MKLLLHWRNKLHIDLLLFGQTHTSCYSHIHNNSCEIHYLRLNSYSLYCIKMNQFLNTIKQNKLFLLFIFVFAYLQSIQIRYLIRNEINGYIFTPEAALATLISASLLFLIIRFFISKFQKSSIPTNLEMTKIFVISILSFVIISKLLSLIIALIFNTVARNFNTHTLILSTTDTFINAIIYGSFYLSYYYFKKSKTHQVQLANYDKALAESRINQLKNQLNPHFLFNNLNVLDQLIEEDQQKASIYLNDFANLYRYVLQASDKKIASVTEEIQFAENYFSIIKNKYGEAYQLSINNLNPTATIVPLALQLLIENAVQHNLGSITSPIYIEITIDKNITVRNNTIPKRTTKTTSGRALKNLQEQYQLLTHEEVEIHVTSHYFTVTIPII